VIEGDHWDAAAVLDRGLPPLPAVLQPGEEVPVAVWRRGRVGAVLSIYHDPDDEEEPFSHDIEVLLHDESSGAWKWHSTGGSDWPELYGIRPVTGHAALTGFATGAPAPDEDGSIWIVSGIAPVGVERVRVVQGISGEVADVERLTGAFLVSVQRLDDASVIHVPRPRQ
jgi:hypothetical protein